MEGYNTNAIGDITRTVLSYYANQKNMDVNEMCRVKIDTYIFMNTNINSGMYT